MAMFILIVDVQLGSKNLLGQRSNKEGDGPTTYALFKAIYTSDFYR